jgi:hypothetical protein
MSVHRIGEFDPFWTDLIQKNPKIKWPFLFFLNFLICATIKKFFFAERHSETRTDIVAKIVV